MKKLMNPCKILPAILCIIGLETLSCHAQGFNYSSENPRSFDLKIDFVPNSALVKFQVYKYSPNKLRLQLRDMRHIYIYDKPISNYLIKNNILLNLQDVDNGEYTIEIWEGRKLVFSRTLIKEHLVLVKPLEVQSISLVNQKL
jgi:hypothetical protein